MTNFIGLGGLLSILAAAYALSNNRKAIDFRLVAWGLGLQVAFAFFILKTSPGNAIFDFLSGAVTSLLGFRAPERRSSSAHWPPTPSHSV